MVTAAAEGILVGMGSCCGSCCSLQLRSMGGRLMAHATMQDGLVLGARVEGCWTPAPAGSATSAHQLQDQTDDHQFDEHGLL